MLTVPTVLSRRRLLANAGLLGALGACGTAPADPPRPDERVDPHGEQQAGVSRPAIAQRHCDLSIWDMSTSDILPALGRRVAALAGGGPGVLAGLAPAGLTVTVGIGPRLVRAAGRDLPGGTDLPVFPGDRVDDRRLGGDLLLQVCAEDPTVVSLAVADLIAAAGGAISLRWRQTGLRGPSRPDGAGRNLFGFVDGIVVPRGDAELAREVWLDTPRGATIAVVRRMRLDVAAFLALPLAEQERVFGRRRDTAEPLSGGGPDAAVDLHAKTSDGAYLIPADAHVRRAHPLTSGSGLMLRRPYGFDDGPDDRGLLFVSFQRDLRTFVATQHRLVEGDALLRYATTTASATFLVLPGFSPDRPLGWLG